MTLREAMLKLDALNMRIRTYGSLQYQIFFREDECIKDACLCDTLEEAILIGHEMRKRRNLTQ